MRRAAPIYEWKNVVASSECLPDDSPLNTPHGDGTCRWMACIEAAPVFAALQGVIPPA